MSRLKKTDPKWVNTFIEFKWNPDKGIYEDIYSEGYWYSGSFALATTPPTLEVTNWAFYEDGTESGSVIIGSVNTNPTLDVDTIYLVRFGLEETSGNASKNTEPQLQYNHNGGGFVNCDETSSVVRIVTTSNITDGDDTTQRITSFTFDSTNEGFDSTTGIAGGPTTDLANDGFEALYCIQILSADVSDQDTIVLKIVNSNDGDADYDVYNQTDPTITVNEESLPTLQSVAGSITSSGTILKSTILSTFVGSLSATGEIIKNIVLGTAFTGSITGSGALVTSLLFLQSVAGSIASIGVITSKTIGKILSGSITSTGTLLKTIFKKVSGSITALGSIFKVITKTAYEGTIPIALVLFLIGGCQQVQQNMFIEVWLCGWLNVDKEKEKVDD